MSPELTAWLVSRPKCVRDLAEEFPLGSIIEGIDGGDWFVIGYTEDDRLIISIIDPWEDYEMACFTRQYLCADHLR